MAKKATYDNESISSLKGADRVRKRPGVIFGSDGLEGCEHAVFEILSNAIAAARAFDANAYATLSDGSHMVSFDKVVEVMNETGHALPSLYRETSEGGLARNYTQK